MGDNTECTLKTPNSRLYLVSIAYTVRYKAKLIRFHLTEF